MEHQNELDRLAQTVIGAAIEVHRALGPGYLELLYEEALCIELNMRHIDNSRQHPIAVRYKGHPIGEGHIDILISSILVVELKAVEALALIHTAQIMSYLRATGLHLGLLINFNVPILKQGIKRVAL